MSGLSEKSKTPKDKNSLYLKGDPEILKFLEEKEKHEKSKKGTVLRSIVKRYVKIYSKMEEDRDIIIPREIVRMLYDSLTKKQMDKITEKTVDFGISYLKKDSNDFSFNRILKSITYWFKIRGMLLEQSNLNNNEIKLYCKHELGEKWAKVSISTVIKLLEMSEASATTFDFNSRDFFINLRKQ